MRTSRKRILKGAARRFGRSVGLYVDRVDAGCYVVQRPVRRRRLVRLGDGHLGTHLLVDEERARKGMNMLQKRMAEFLAKEQVAWVLRATEANVVLDVGANVGQFGRALRDAGYRGRIVSFEPVPEPFAELEREASNDPDWWVRPYALGAQEGVAQINTTPGTMSSLLPASEFGKEWTDKLREMRTETIRIRTLDDVLPEVTGGLGEVRAYLKLDTQGFDLEVFEGAGAALRSVVAMQSEVACVPIYDGMPRLPAQMTTYEAAGFEAAGMFPVSRDLPTLRVIEFDLVMVRPDEVRRPRA